MYNKREAGARIGIPSIILVLVVLCLVVFGVLALVTVDRDAKLTRRTSQSILNFYKADSQAEEALVQLDTYMIQARQELESWEDWDTWSKVKQDRAYKEKLIEALSEDAQFVAGVEDDNQLVVSYQIPIDTRQILKVKVLVRPYERGDMERYTPLEWVVHTGEEWEYKELEFQEIKIED